MKVRSIPNIEKRRDEPTDAQIAAAKKRISRARMTIASFCRFFGYLVLKSTPIVARPEHGVDTAAVAPDGTTYFNAHFVAELSDAELCGVVIHEILHPALLCWKRQGNRKAMVATPSGQVISLWNLAHDLSFNPEIEDLSQKTANGKIKLPKAAAIDPTFKGKSAEEIYAKLLALAQKSPPVTLSGGFVEGTLDMPGTGDDSLGDDLRPDLSTTETGKKAAKGDKLAQQKMDNDWRVSVVAAAIAHEKHHGRGHLPAGFQKLVDELQENKVDWKEVLSQWIGEKGVNLDFTYRRPARRSESAGLYLPSYQKYGIDDVIVLWDTSGSMYGREKAILSEIRSICEDLGLVIRVICCDAAIHSDTHDVAQAIDMIGQIKGGGGSDFNPAFALLEQEQYEGVVVAFTDGHIGVPETKPPLIKDVLWCINEGKSGYGADRDPTNGRWGDVLKIEGD